MNRKKLPIGLSDYKRLIEEDFYYVDKTLLIKEIMDTGSVVLLFPRPRRFGKTLNLSMLRYFYEKTDEDTSHLFRHLNIWRQGKSYTRMQGQHPVIFLTFKDVKCDNWEECENQLKRVISNEYDRHREILSKEKFDTVKKEQFQAILDLSADKTAYENSIMKLSEWLHQYYGKRTIILIDEYDTPIQSGYMGNYYKPVIGFMRNLLSAALKDNSHLEKGILTGILRVAKESIFSGLNNLEVCSLLVPEFSTHFGLLEPEVDSMLNDYEVGLDREEIKLWYNGYMFGDTTIYNPWSIINFVAKWRNGLQPYWVNTSSNDLIRQMISRGDTRVKQDLEVLMRGEKIEKAVDDNVVFGEIELSSDALWSFLLMSGYLKLVSQERRNKKLYGDLTVPNLEVEYLYEEIIRSWFNESIHSNHYRMMLEALVGGDLETFEAIFGDFVMKSFSYFDTSGTEPEKVYHAFVLGLLLGLNDTHEVKSNRESGYGRYDVMIIPKRPDRSLPGIIIEFKKVGPYRKETLEEAAEAALRQIEQKQYVRELEERGISIILQLGIAFQGKEIRMKSR